MKFIYKILFIGVKFFNGLVPSDNLSIRLADTQIVFQNFVAGGFSIRPVEFFLAGENSIFTPKICLSARGQNPTFPQNNSF